MILPFFMIAVNNINILEQNNPEKPSGGGERQKKGKWRHTH
jgi:hypothetical protein